MIWKEFFARLLSPATARFILALLALGCAAYGGNKLLNQGNTEPSQGAVFAVGQLFALAAMAFGYYFGSTARGDSDAQPVKITNTPRQPVPVEDLGEQK